MKKIIAVLLMIILLTGCSDGPSQAEYDELKAKYDALNENVSEASIEEEGQKILDEMSLNTLEGMCEQIRPNTTVNLMGDKGAVFVLPLGSEETKEKIAEVDKCIMDYMQVFSLTYSLTQKDNFYFRCENNSGNCIFEYQFYFSPDGVEMSVSVGAEYISVVNEALKERK